MILLNNLLIDALEVTLEISITQENTNSLPSQPCYARRAILCLEYLRLLKV